MNNYHNRYQRTVQDFQTVRQKLARSSKLCEMCYGLMLKIETGMKKAQTEEDHYRVLEIIIEFEETVMDIGYLATPGATQQVWEAHKGSFVRELADFNAQKERLSYHASQELLDKGDSLVAQISELLDVFGTDEKVLIACSDASKLRQELVCVTAELYGV